MSVVSVSKDLHAKSKKFMCKDMCVTASYVKANQSNDLKYLATEKQLTPAVYSTPN